jgi:hypothetical protein
MNLRRRCLTHAGNRARPSKAAIEAYENIGKLLEIEDEPIVNDILHIRKWESQTTSPTEFPAGDSYIAPNPNGKSGWPPDELKRSFVSHRCVNKSRHSPQWKKSVRHRQFLACCHGAKGALHDIA